MARSSPAGCFAALACLLLLGLTDAEEVHSDLEPVGMERHFEIGSVTDGRVEALRSENADDGGRAAADGEVKELQIGDFIGTVFQYLFGGFVLAFMVIWLCAWNTGVAAIFQPGVESCMRGEYLQGIQQIAMGLICPHTLIGIFLPYGFFGWPWCCIFYFPYLHMIYKTWKEVRENPDGPARRMSSEQSFAEVVELHRHPRLTLTSSFSRSSMVEDYKSEKGRLAHEMSECLICGKPLYTKPVGVLMARARTIPVPQIVGESRACKHYFHHECLSRRTPGSCPICRTPFEAAMPLPVLSTDPMSSNNEAFFYLASSGAYQLQKEDLKAALSAVTAFSGPSLQTAVDDLCGPAWSMRRMDFEHKVPPFMAVVRQGVPVARSDSLRSLYATQPISRMDLFDMMDTRNATDLRQVDRAQLVRGFWQCEVIQNNSSKEDVEAAVYNTYRIFYQHQGFVTEDDFCKNMGFFHRVCRELQLDPFLR